MDLTATTADLTAAATDAARLLPARAPDPVLSGVLLTADATGVTVAGTDAERTVALRRPALVHTEGTVLVPGRPLADTLRALDVPEVRLVVEGARLAVRTRVAGSRCRSWTSTCIPACRHRPRWPGGRRGGRCCARSPRWPVPRPVMTRYRCSPGCGCGRSARHCGWSPRIGTGWPWPNCRGRQRPNRTC
jgi:DNA polymerase III beta subunit-like protein